MLNSRISNFKFQISNSQHSWAGFTLIEVLVAIAIIGVVFGVIISSTNALQKNSRDTQRKADLRNIQTALQQYYADQNFYPTSYNLTTALNNCTNNPVTPCTVSRTYLSNPPSEPQPGNSAYCYLAYINSALTPCQSTDKCHYYTLNTKLEGQAAGSTSCGSGSQYNYQLTPIP